MVVEQASADGVRILAEAPDVDHREEAAFGRKYGDVRDASESIDYLSASIRVLCAHVVDGILWAVERGLAGVLDEGCGSAAGLLQDEKHCIEDMFRAQRSSRAASLSLRRSWRSCSRLRSGHVGIWRGICVRVLHR